MPNDTRLNQWNTLCDTFEEAWRSGKAPSIEVFLERVAAADRPELLRELLALEIDYRRQRGQVLDTTEVMANFPRQAGAATGSLAGSDACQGTDPTCGPTRAWPDQRGEAVPSALSSTENGNSCDFDLTHFSCLPRRSHVSVLPAETRIGNYELLEEIARGGMGVVFKARQVNLNRIVAVKMILSGEFAGQKEVDRFRGEAEAAAHLKHPHIVSIYEIGEERGLAYFSMEYIDGQDLHEALRNGPWSPQRAAELMQTTAEAVQYAHAHGIIHRDLKPRNILLDHDGQPHVTDFGLARRQGADQHLTVTGQVLGTPGYMPPEQAKNRSHEIGPESDVYSLGALLYMMLTGRPPFQAANYVETLQQVVSADPLPLRAVNPAVPRDLETICLKCLEKDPRGRYASAQELADELGRYLRIEPIVARPLGPFGRAWRWCRRRPALAALYGAVAAAVLILACGLFAYDRSLAKFNSDLSRLNADLTATTASARKMQRVAEEHERQIQVALYAAEISRAAVAWREGDTRGLTELLERHIPAPGEPDRRGFEWWYLRRQASRECQVLLETESPLYFLCYAPDLRLMAAAGQDSIVRLFDPESGKVAQEIATGQIEVNGLAFSPDGQELATAGDDGTIRLWNLAAQSERLKIAAHPGKAFQLLFTKDGRRLVSCGDDPVIRVFDIGSGVQTQTLSGHDADVQSIVLGQDGTTLASTSGDRTVKLWDLDSGKPTFSWTSSHRTAPVVLLQNRSLLLISGNVRGLVQTINAAQLGVISVVSHLDKIGALALHPDGKLLAVGDGAGGIRLWELGPQGDLEPGSFHPWQAHRGTVRSLVWSRDGSRLYSAGDDGKVTSWSLAAARRRGPRNIEIEASETFCLIPQTTWMVPVGGSRAVLTAWDWKTGTRIKNIDEHSYYEVAAAPNGRYLAALDYLGELKVFPTRPENELSSGAGGIAAWHGDGELKRACFSADSRVIAVALWKKREASARDDNSTWLLNLPDLNEAERLPFDARLAEFAPDGRRLAVAAKEDLVLWDSVERKSIWKIRQPDVTQVVFSPDGSLMVTGGDNRLVIVRSTADGSVRYRLNSHRALIRSIAFTPDGRTLATTSDGAVKLWHVATGQEMFELPVADARSRMARFTPDGRHLLWQIHIVPEINDKIVVFDASANGDDDG